MVDVEGNVSASSPPSYEGAVLPREEEEEEEDGLQPGQGTTAETEAEESAVESVVELDGDMLIERSSKGAVRGSAASPPDSEEDKSSGALGSFFRSWLS
ncbi:unnamed protein product [Amoebophrya sp. A25]|nr:unnamed protein product [Amoebophrya sp. A25]|eukprot:GSA25T00020992001.1